MRLIIYISETVQENLMLIKLKNIAEITKLIIAEYFINDSVE